MIRKMLFTVAVCVGFTAVQAQSFTLQQVMSAPFSTSLLASPKGSMFLWVADQEGKRNIWVADAAAGAAPAHRVTSYLNDEGLEIDNIRWTPDGQSIVFVRGGDFEHAGRGAAPNPADITAGVEQTIYIVPAAGGEPRKLAEGRAPSVSPDGAMIVYLAREQLYTIALNDPAAKPVLMFHARDAGIAGVFAGWQAPGVYKRTGRSRVCGGLFACRKVDYVDGCVYRQRSR